MAKPQELETNGHNLISIGTSIKGDIISEFDIRIDGKHSGKLDTKGKVVLGPSGTIKGNISCKNAVIEGKIEGTIIVAEILELKSTGFIKGDITTNKLTIQPGAKFIGNCDANGSNKTLSNAEKKPEEKQLERLTKEIK